MRWKEKPTGIKILWLWAFGTTGILVTSVLRARLNEMQNMLNAAEEEERRIQQEAKVPQFSDEDVTIVDNQIIREDKE